MKMRGKSAVQESNYGNASNASYVYPLSLKSSKRLNSKES